jgi:tRNA A-37 threonylcarbamoyl transferase component Bud32
MKAEGTRQTKKIILLAGHEAELLSRSKKGNGRHLVAKLTWNETPVVIKCYGLKRSFLKTIIRQYASPVITGKSSVSVSSRYHTERKMLQLWKRLGFDVPAILDIPLLSEIPGPCLAMEWIPGPTLADFFRHAHIPLARKKQVM